MQPTPTTAADPASGSANPQHAEMTPSEARLQRNLKIIVVAMGVLIFAGLATIVGRIIYLASGTGAQPPVAATAVVPFADAGHGQALDLPQGAVVRSIALSGDRLAVHYEAAGAEGIAVLDLATGRALTRVDLRRSTNPGN